VPRLVLEVKTLAKGAGKGVQTVEMPIDLIIGMGLAKNALDIVRGVREALKQKKLTDEEMRDYLETLQDKLVHVKTALADADDERRSLLARIAELERYADVGKDFKPAHGVYWYATYPYCPTCWDVDRKPVRLAGPAHRQFNSHRDVWTCPLHKAEYMIQGGAFGERQQ